MTPVAMISGANRGIGEAIARKLLAEGFQVSLGVRAPASAAHLVSEYGEAQCFICPYDASVQGSGRSWVEQTLKRFGHLQALVNNAGMYGSTTLEGYEDQDLNMLIQVNTLAVLEVSKAALPYLEASKGRFVNIVSISGKKYFEGECLGYTISKFGAMAVSEILQAHGSPDVQTTAICPGLVNTHMARSLCEVPPEEMIQPAHVATMVSTVLSLPPTVEITEIIMNDTT